MRIRLAAVLVPLALALGIVSPAQAAISATFSAGTLTINGDENSDQIIVVCTAGNDVLINGSDPPAPAGPRECNGNLTTVGQVVVNGNGGNDVIDIGGMKPEDESLGDSSVDGGASDDQLRGLSLPSPGDAVTLVGGQGNDLLTPNGSELVYGGSGDDVFAEPVSSQGLMDGESGTDTAVYDFSAAPPSVGGGVTFAPSNSGLLLSAGGATAGSIPWSSIEVSELILNDAPQTADGRAFAGSMRVQARGGADTIYGTEQGDLLDGGADNDFVEGLGGADLYQGGGGFDRIHARDGIADSGDCGSDEDILIADAIDSLVGCERIELGPPPPDTKKPKLKLKKATLGSKLRLRIACPADEIRCTGLLKLAGVGKLGKAKKQVKLGALPVSLAGGKSRTLTRTVSERQRTLLDQLSRLKLQVKLDVTDAAGNRARSRSLLPLSA